MSLWGPANGGLEHCKHSVCSVLLQAAPPLFSKGQNGVDNGHSAAISRRATLACIEVKPLGAAHHQLRTTKHYPR